MRVSEIVFSEKGYQETKMTDIAERLHISRGPLYYHYKSKGELFTATVEYHMQNMLDDVKRIFNPKRGKKIVDLFVEDLHNRMQTLDFGTCAHYAISNGGAAMQEAKSIWIEALHQTYDIKLREVRRAEMRGELREGITPEHCVEVLFVFYGGIRSAKSELRSIHADDDVSSLDANAIIDEMECYMRQVLFY